MMNPQHPFILPPGAASDPRINRVRIFESVVSAIVIGILSAAAAGYVALRINAEQTDRLAKADEKKGEQIVMILTQIAVVQTTLAGVQTTLAGVVQQQAYFAREMNDRIALVERRAYRQP